MQTAEFLCKALLENSKTEDFEALVWYIELRFFKKVCAQIIDVLSDCQARGDDGNEGYYIHGMSNSTLILEEIKLFSKFAAKS